MRRYFTLATLLLLVPVTAHADPPPGVRIEQITHAPGHHFYGYIGHVGNTPWNAAATRMILLRNADQDRMPEAGEAADIILLDTEDDYRARKVAESRGWNPQQGAMLYWNPAAPDTQFFFNDRDPETNNIFTVLYDIKADRRIREYRFDDRPVANSGLSHDGRHFLALNYGRMDRLREVTGYPGAFDWTKGDAAPENDGLWKINIKTGEKELIASFARLADAIRSRRPDIDEIPLFINHTLWSRDNQRILIYLRGWWTDRGDGPRVNQMIIVSPDGSTLTVHDTFPGGHPEWGSGPILWGTVDREQIAYDVDQQKVVRTIGDRTIFRDPEGDIALSPDGRWFVNGYRKRGDNAYVIYDLQTDRHIEVDGFTRGDYQRGPLRLDPAPCWRPDAKALAVPALAPDGTRQTFIIHLDDAFKK
jgi:hypothetical protein